MTVTPRLDIPGTFTVQSGKETYNVDTTVEHWTCDCKAGCYRDGWCKHRAEVAKLLDKGKP